MTRETKIGLLVGLAFIIVIGILLNDYNRNDNAQLAQVADTVRSGTATIHNGSSQSEIVPPPAAAAPPSRVVPTQQDIHRPDAVVNIGPGNSGNTLAARTDEHPVEHETHDNGASSPVSGDPANPTPGRPDDRAVASNDNGPRGISGTIPFDPNHPMLIDPAPERVTTPPVAPAPPAAPTINGAKQYVAVAGDTLSKLAGRFLGANTKTNREAIIAINPTLKANPNNVVVGRTYLIPPKNGTTTVATTASAHPATPPVSPAPAPSPTPAHADTAIYYTVKENDNLWKIASEQLGDGTAWAAIKELNKDVLKNGDAVRPNMRLKMPAKPLASAN